MTDPTLYLGIDGGGSGCRARLADASGRVLGEGAGEAANLTLGVARSIAAVLAAAHGALASAGLPAAAIDTLVAGIGLAGADAGAARLAQFGRNLPFSATRVRNDAEIACLGAHAGEDGAILILGTGSHGVLIRGGTVERVGGWGFLLSDTGSGAVLGHRAARQALAAHEGLVPGSPLTAAIFARFDADPARMLEWALVAIPRDWAALAPRVFDAAAAGDPVGIALVDAAIDEVEALVSRLVALGAQRVALLGGLADPYRRARDRRLDRRFGALLVEPRGDPLDGALRLARDAMLPTQTGPDAG
jgi:glucosamine kinase